MDRVRNLINCDQLHRLGYTGRGVGVAILDTGECVNGMQNRKFTSLKDALSFYFGNSIKIRQTERISGGDINEAYKLLLSDGTHIFMKSNTKANASFFAAEVLGLAAIAKTGTIGTPHILCTGTDEGRGGCSFLLLEFVEGKKRIADFWEVFAQQLAAMHQAPAEGFVSGGRYGFIEDNYIGAGRQVNTAYDSWPVFFRSCRLEPQLRCAARYFDKSDVKRISGFLEHIDSILVEPAHPSLLHGDLWSGNFITGNDGRAWLIDPAVYVGHAEADLAMTELFGGFPQSFYEAYAKAAPLQDGYSQRRDLYHLYHLLNHLNLFGRTYLMPVKNIINKYTS